MRSLPDIARFFAAHHVRLATAESCTAGLIAARIADVPGCGGVLQCAIVAYAPAAKTGLLGVAPELVTRHGLTSEPVSCAMARGVMALADVTLAIANTGVADGHGDGPTPAGTQCFAWLFRVGGHTRIFSETVRFHGARNAVRTAAADWALSRAMDHYLGLQAESC